MSKAPRVPKNTESTKGAHFRTLIGSSASVVGGAVLAAAVFTVGAATGHAGVMVLGPLAVAVGVLGICYFVADDRAENEFFTRWAAAHELMHAERYQTPEYTPLLGGGDRRRCNHWMQSASGDGIGWFTFEVRHENGDKPDTWEPHEFTIAVTDLGELGMQRFQGIYLRRRRGIFDKLDTESNWLRTSRLKRVELESSAFTEKFELWADEDQDEVVLRQLFSPRFILWMAEHPLSPGFELRAGMLVVFIPGHCGEAGKLEWLRMAARDIATRIQAELTEAAQARIR